LVYIPVYIFRKSAIQYYTDRTIPKSNRKCLERCKIKYFVVLSWLGKGKGKSGGG
jgi:hypothetical protein